MATLSIHHPLLGHSVWRQQTRNLFSSKSASLWDVSSMCDDLSEEFFFSVLTEQICALVSSFSSWKQTSFELGYHYEYQGFIQTELFNNSPNSFQQTLFSFFRYHFALASTFYCKGVFIDNEEDDEEMEEGKESEINEEMLAAATKLLLEACEALNELHLLVLCDSIINSVCCEELENLVKSKCRTGLSFETGRLSQMIDWLHSFAFPWIKETLGSLQESPTFHSLHCSLCTRLEFFAHESFANLRISELFDIIIDFPESTPALQDLRKCLVQTNQLPFLVKCLTQAFKKRLLHPGANTTDIIVQFINTIKALHLLDPNIACMDVLSQPIRQYLLHREDTVRCVVSMFTDEESDLYEELTQDLEANEKERGKSNWEPTPSHSLTTASSKPLRDTFSHLVHLFGSKESFVNEYRNMLAERLLNASDFKMEREMGIIEILKLRFGESCLQYCDIMIKDVSSSKRMNKLVHEERREATEFQTLIISHLFWPSFRDDSLLLPPAIEDIWKDYHAGYRTIKRDRKLTWIPFLGSVDLEIEVAGDIKSLTVNPLQATIIYHFQEKEEWALSELSEVMGITTDSLRKRISFWLSQGVLQQTSTPDVYSVREDGGNDHGDLTGMEEEEEESALTSAEEEKEGMWALCFNFINACLANHGAMGADKIHFMLSSLMRDDYKASQSELRVFLEGKVKQDLLEKEDGNLFKSKD